ncbi:MAG: DUF5720 family protein [Eubacteriales bacterium]|nr:DUF5720 family protein [Eubacteriales bacterium]
MQDISAKELKGHDILAVERFLDEAGYQQVLTSQKQGEIRIKRDAHVIEGHILLKKKRRRH